MSNTKNSLTDAELDLKLEELKLLINKKHLIILYSEYREYVDEVTYDDDEARLKDDLATPEWFVKWQKKALKLFEKVIAQVHLIPRNRLDYLDLRTIMWIERGTNIYHTEAMDFKETFRNALIEQIKFMYDNEAWYDNGYLNAMVGFGVGAYHQGGMQMYQMNKLFKGLCPAAYDYLESMGWMNMCLNHPVRHEDFYKGEQ